MIYQNIWFLLWAVLWTVYFMLDGYDIGTGIVSPFVAKSDEERGMIIKGIGPFWDGNEVWLVTAGGATFAAFPRAYAGIFSYLYTPLLLLLLTLIIRGVSIEFGYTDAGLGWKRLWQRVFFVSSLILAVVFGLAFGNLFRGVPFDQNGLRGGLLGLINPAGIIASVLFLMTFGLHGSLWLMGHSEGSLKERAYRLAKILLPLTFLLTVLFFTYLFLDRGFRVNFFKIPLLFILPLCSLIILFIIYSFLKRQSNAIFITSMSFILSLFATGFAGMYPALLPSSISPEFDFTIYNSSSSIYTLKIMTTVALIFVPVVILYQNWVHRVFRR